MRTLLVSIASSLLLAASAAEAQGGMESFLKPTPSLPPDSGLSIGARVAYGIPIGNASGGGDSLSSIFSGTYPLQLDAGWRFSPSLYVGAFVQYAFASLASVGDACVGGMSCSGHDIRAGVDAVYTFTPESKLLPWVGVGLGYEWLKYSVESAGQSVEISTKGFEFAHVSVGLDYRVSALFRIGPFATLTFAQFSSIDTPVAPGSTQIGATQSYDITDKSLHEWLQLGLKGTFDF